MFIQYVELDEMRRGNYGPKQGTGAVVCSLFFLFSGCSPSSQQVIGELAPASHSGVNYEEGAVGGNMLCSAQPGGLWCVQGSFCDLEGKCWWKSVGWMRIFLALAT